MKKLILLCILTLGFYQMTFSQNYGWKDISANMPESANLNDIHVIGEEVWITGWEDGVFYSPDGGETFQIQTLPANSGISSSVFMKSNKLGYVVTYNGKILKTENGGTNWTMLYEPGGTLNSVHFPPTLDIGYTCGNNGKIYAFTDSSINELTTEGLTVTLESIMFPVNSGEGKLCGNSSIRRWLNDIWNNLQIFDSTYFYNSIFFTDNNTGWVVGSLGKIFKTVDATTWNGQASPTTKSLNDVFFIDSIEGWAAGVEVLLHTVDGGENWVENTELDLTGKTLTALWFNSPHEGYAVSNKGTLYKYTKLTTGVKQKLATAKFDVFPNPVQSKLKVQSSKLKVESATAAVFTITGRKCLSKYVPAGSSEVEIDISSLNSGMYFCKIQFGDICVTKKIVVKK